MSRAGRGVKVVPSVATAMGTGEVLGIHEVVPKPGVTPAELERFAAEEFGPVLKDVFPGIRVRLYTHRASDKLRTTDTFPHL